MIVRGMAICGDLNKRYTNRSHLMKLWQKILVIPSSSAICERGFSKQKIYQEPLVSFIEGEHFGCFHANIIVWDRGRQYGLKGSI